MRGRSTAPCLGVRPALSSPCAGESSSTNTTATTGSHCGAAGHPSPTRRHALVCRQGCEFRGVENAEGTAGLLSDAQNSEPPVGRTRVNSSCESMAELSLTHTGEGPEPQS